jgi:hypothetical protein
MSTLGRRRDALGAERFEQRRRREAEAPRLGDEVPALRSLRLAVSESLGPLDIKHVRHIVVRSAPALFLVCCADPQCRGGVHNLTGAVMRSLKARSTTFDGDDDCNGTVAATQAACKRVLHFEAVATYASS